MFSSSTLGRWICLSWNVQAACRKVSVMSQKEASEKVYVRKKPTESQVEETNRRLREKRRREREQRLSWKEYVAKISEIRKGMDRIHGNGPFDGVRKERVNVDGMKRIFAGDDGHIYSSRGLPPGMFRRMDEIPALSGRLRVRINMGTKEDKQVELFHVDQLVADAFLGPSPGKEYDVLHLDGDWGNSRPQNLRWERKEVVRPLVNRHLQGENSTSAILTAEKVAEIRRRSAAGERRVRLAEEFGVSAPTISAIVMGRIWKDTAPQASPPASREPVMGEAHWNAKMTMEKAEEMRRRHLAGESSASLARAYGISKNLTNRILRGAAWMPILLKANEIRDLWFRTGDTASEIAARYNVPETTIRMILLPVTRGRSPRLRNPYEQPGEILSPSDADLVDLLSSGEYPAGGQVISPREVVFRRFDGSCAEVRVATGRMEIRNLIGHGLVVVGWRMQTTWICATRNLSIDGSCPVEEWPEDEFCEASLDELFPRGPS